MKKIMLIAAIVFATVAANAAATKWTFVASKMTGKDLTTPYAGLVTIYASGGDLESPIVLASGTAANGAFSKANFTVETLTQGTKYDFYFVLADNVGGVDYTLTSSIKSVTAPATGTGMLTYGDQSQLTTNPANWQSSSAPEPTSGLLLLLGVAGIALKRKRA